MLDWMRETHKFVHVFIALRIDNVQTEEEENKSSDEASLHHGEREKQSKYHDFLAHLLLDCILQTTPVQYSRLTDRCKPDTFSTSILGRDLHALTARYNP